MTDAAGSAQSTMNVPWYREPTKDQWLAWVAGWLGWTLDAFDFTMFLLIMVPISKEFGVPLTEVAFVLSVTLWLRLVGAVTSGWFADRIGRKTPLMVSILLYSALQLRRRLLADLRGAVLVPRPARPRHGRRMARRRRARDGILAGPLTRIHERHPARFLEPRLPVRQPGLRPAVQRHRLARHAVDRHPAGASSSSTSASS